MNTWYKYFVVLLATVTFHQAAQAQEDQGPPQEPPYVQDETEYEYDELQPTNSEPETVNLNEQTPSDSKIEEDLMFEEDSSAVVESIPEPEPVQQVAPVPKASQGEVVRRSKSGGVEYIQHPQAAKGLMTITKDGAYVYRVKPQITSKESGSFRVGMMDSPQIDSADGVTTYETMYGGSSQAMFMFDYEWKPFNGYGSLGLQAGLGLLYSTGQGRFITPDAQFPDQKAKEEYSFLAVPINLGGVYRLEWSDRQWIAPYISAGGTYIAVAEIRDDGKSPSLVGTPGVYGAGGLLFNVSAMSSDTAFTLSSEYGIHNLWLSLEYRQLQTFSEDVDFSGGIVGAGVTVDY